MRSTTQTLWLEPVTGRLRPLIGPAIAALVAGVLLLAGASTAEARTVIFKDGVGASATVTWDTSGGTLKYYGTVYDKKGDGYHARILRVNDRSAPRLIATATYGGHTNFGSSSRPLETSLPAYFRVCTYNEDERIACTDRFQDADPNEDPSRYRQWTCNSTWIRQVSTEGWGRGFVTSVWPTTRARLRGHDDDVQRELWRDLQECLDFAGNGNFGMNGDQLHMMKLQLDCHAQFGKTPSDLTGGPTWDLEANSPKTSYRRLVLRRCH